MHELPWITILVTSKGIYQRWQPLADHITSDQKSPFAIVAKDGIFWLSIVKSP